MRELQIWLSFLAAAGGAALGGLINLIIHKSSIRNIKSENDKNRKATELEAEKARKTQISVAMLNFMKVNNVSDEELVKIVSGDNFKTAFDLMNNLIKAKENIQDRSSDNNKKLDNDIIKAKGALDYVREN